MLIKQSALNFQPNKKLPALFFLIGQELFQINSLATSIKSTWRKMHKDDVEITTLCINSAADWLVVEQEANSYSLFCNNILLDIRYDKKTLDAPGKKFLENYSKSNNPNCLLLIQAPQLGLKQLQSIVNVDCVHVIQSISPDSGTIKQWIAERLKKMVTNYDQEIPTLIHQYNEGNLLACEQVLLKLELIAEKDELLTLAQVKEQLINQCAYPLFDLSDSCLTGDKIKALSLLQQAHDNKTEPTLVLWLLTQEVRILMQLLHLNAQNIPMRDIASQLKIWPQRIKLYQSAIKKFNKELLLSLLRFCNQLDSQIKTSQSKQIWQSFDCITLSLCTGKLIGAYE